MADQPLQDFDLVSIARAVRAMRMDRSAATRWLRRHGLILMIEGRQRVLWGSVVDTLKGEVERQALVAQGGKAPQLGRFKHLNRVNLG
jgi:hypothetical protein